MKDDRIKYNHIRHTQEALEDIFEGLEKQDKTLLDIGVGDLVVFGLELADYDKHDFECLYPSTNLIPDLPNMDYTNAWMSAQLVQELLNHQYYDKNGDVWHDAVEKLMVQIYELLDNGNKNQQR